MSKLSIVMITKNSASVIRKSLQSVTFADEILIVDSGSTDETVAIAKEFGATVHQKEWLGFGQQKQLAVDLSTHQWVFSLDSDEVFTPELEREVKALLQHPKHSAYRVARLNYFFGKPIKRMGLYPDYTVRLFNKEVGYFSLDEVHEKVKVSDKNVGTLQEHFLHYAYEDIETFIAKQNRYSSLNAKENKMKALINPFWTFFKLYFLKLGFLEGFRGFVIARLYAQYTFWKYIK